MGYWWRIGCHSDSGMVAIKVSDQSVLCIGDETLQFLKWAFTGNLLGLHQTIFDLYGILMLVYSTFAPFSFIMRVRTMIPIVLFVGSMDLFSRIIEAGQLLNTHSTRYWLAVALLGCSVVLRRYNVRQNKMRPILTQRMNNKPASESPFPVQSDR